MFIYFKYLPEANQPKPWFKKQTEAIKENKIEYQILKSHDLGFATYQEQLIKFPYMKKNLQKKELSRKTYPPRDWWQDTVTIEEVELEHRIQIEYQISRAKKVGILVYNNKIKDFQMASADELKKYIIKLNSQKTLYDPGWIKLKSLYKAGDIIRKYVAPPLTGSVGYILIRNNKVIYNYQVGIQ